MQTKSIFVSKRILAAVTIALAGISITACTTTPPTATTHEESRVDRHELNSKADAALARLYQTAPSSRELVARAKGVLIFPSVYEAGWVVGGEYGKGILRVDGVPENYYQTVKGSVGFQLGAQSKAMILLFMTQDSLEKFRRSNGWEAGADATVAVADIGANGDIGTNITQQPVIGFVMTNAGLMAGVSLQGAKFSRISI